MARDEEVTPGTHMSFHYSPLVTLFEDDVSPFFTYKISKYSLLQCICSTEVIVQSAGSCDMVNTGLHSHTEENTGTYRILST
jgi:hypothetical protein